ncbi:MAG: nuclear transport factor 2 family protein [Ignavibacteriales bacterium]|nr:nuclear transport factor 2 family protein [Ignavibacteriales bacterium]
MTKLELHVNPADVMTVDGIVKALYESVSFVSGGQPDYDRLRSVFHPDGRLIPPKGEKETKVHVLDVETFITRSREYVVISGLERKGFAEKEIARRSQAFGSIVQLFSTYESRHVATDPIPIQRGINSIQLLKEGGRWWVVSILWDVERPNNPVPKVYLA